MSKTKADSMLRAWLGFGEENRPSSRERGAARETEKTRAAKLFLRSFSDSCLWAEEKPSCEAGQALTKVLIELQLMSCLFAGQAPSTHAKAARALPRTSLSVQVTFVSKWRQFSASQIVFRFWADGILFVRLGKILFKATRDRLRNEIAFWQVSYVCEWQKRNLRARKSQRSQSARAGGRVLKNLSRVKWKPVARERPRSRSRENRRLPISESDWRRQNVQSRCGQCVGTQNALHFLITQAWHD